MTQRERQLHGLLFDAHSKELIELKHQTHHLCQIYNNLDENDQQRRLIIKKMLGSIGNRVYFQGPVQFNYGCNTFIGNDFFANFNLTVLDDAKIIIGNHVMVGPNVSLMASCHPLNYSEREATVYPDGHQSMSEYAKGITIEDHVWLACGVTVCDGVTIGEGSVIGAGSVVTKDIPSGYLACGVPCRPIRKITDQDSCAALL